MVSFGVLSAENTKKIFPEFYPNPASAVVIFNNLWSSNPSFRLTQLSGKLVMEGKIKNNKINIRDLSAGQYILFVEGYSAVIIGKQP
jgi:hypothetical protein